MKKLLLILSVLFLWTQSSWAQTTLISPTGDGGFENATNTFPANGWSVINGTYNMFYVGNAPVASDGLYCAFSGSNSTTWTGTANSCVNHYYRDITFGTESLLDISFKYKVVAPDATYDFLKVYLVSTGTTPVAGTQLASGQIGIAYDAATTWTTVTLSGINASSFGTAVRLVFSWKGDGISPHAAVAVDYITVTSNTPPPPITGTKTINPVGGDYTTFAAAVSALNISGVGAGGVTFNVADGTTYTETGLTISATGTAANPIVFQQSGSGTKPIINFTGTSGTSDFGFKLSSSDYITFNGLDIRDAGTSSTNYIEYGIYLLGAATDGCKNNTIKNCVVDLTKANTSSRGIYLSSVASAATGANTTNKFYNNTIQDSYNGYYFNGSFTSFDDANEVNTELGGTSLINNIGGSSSTVYGIYIGYQTNLTIANTTLSNLTATTTIYGIYESLGSTNTVNYFSNELKTFTGTSSTVYGISLTTGLTHNIYSNSIHGISAATTVYGISISSGTTNNVYKNSIYDINYTGTSTSIAYGLSVSGGTTNNIYNNFIYDIRAAAATTGNPSVRALSLSGGTTDNIFYNTVFIDYTSSNASNQSAALYITPGPTTVNMQNNIFINKCVMSTGTRAVAFYKSSTSYTNLASTNNNNLFYAGTPGAKNLLFYDLTNSDQTLANLKSRLSPREAQSATENVTFTSSVSPYNLHVNTGISTQVESGGVRVTSPIAITTDYDADIRQGETGYAGTGTAPDIGADEFNGIGLDISAPVITYTAIGNQLPATPIILTATISDLTGVPTSGIGLPVLYYKINSGSYTAVTAGHSGGTNYIFSFTPATSALDVVSYYVVAQDIATTVNIGANPSAGASGFTANPPACSTPPTSPNTFNVVNAVTGTYTVGSTGRDYATLKAAFDYINANVVSGNITLDVQSEGTSETATAVLNQVSYSSGPWTITIKPNTTATITGAIASAAIIKLNGADNVVIDGSNSGGTDKSLTITNSSATSPTAIWIASTGSGAGATINTIKNLIISTGSNTTGSYGIVAGGSTIASTGADNDNNTIQNNNISKAYIGIWAQGSATSNPGLMDNLSITGNSVGSVTSGSSIGLNGLVLANATGCSVLNNEIFGITNTSSSDAVSILTGVFSSSFSKNKVYNIINNGTNRATAFGIGSSSSANLTFDNNIIFGVINNGTGGNAFGGYGFYVSAGSGYNFYYNSVYLSGDRDAVTVTDPSSISSCMFIASGISSLDIRDNVFENTQTATTNLPKSYAIYSSSANTAFTTINYNDYYVSGAQGVLGYLGADQANLAAIQVAFGQNANSISADPLFTSTTNLLPTTGTTLLGAATPIGGVTTDYNGTTRNVTTPTIGAYELEITDAIDWANLQWPDVATIPEGSAVTVYAQVYEPGVTPGAGQGAGIQCWIGWSAANTNPNTWTNWTVATHNAANTGSNDEYSAAIGSSLAAGTYYYASRVIIAGGVYQYGGYSAGGGGFWNGTGNNSGVLTVTNSDITWANTQFPAAATITQGGSADIYARVFVDGVTATAGASAAIQAWIGYGTSSSDLSGYTWTVATFNAQQGSNDEYVATIGAALAPGTYYYASRFKFLSDPDVYGGYSVGGGGFWDGTAYTSGTLTVNPYTVTTFPWQEGFEGTFVPVGWSNTTWEQSTYGAAHGGIEWAYSNLSGSALITPAIQIPASGNYEFSYWYRAESASYSQNMNVLLSTDGISYSTTVSSHIGIINATYIKVTYSLSGFLGQTIYIKFVGLTGTGGSDYGILVDDVQVLNLNTQWSGATSTDWTVAGNWSDGVPTSGMNVTIPDVTNNPVIATAVTVNNLTINSGGVLSISPAGQLTVTTALTNNGGTGGLVLESDGSGTGSLMHNSDNVNATIERYVTGSPVLTNLHYHNVAIPMNADMTAAVFTGMYAFNFNAEGTPQTWVSLGSSTSTPVYKDRGYMIYSPLSSTTISFAGQMNNGNFTTSTPSGASTFVSPDYLGGYNLVPNPYPSAIDWNVASGFTEVNLRTNIWAFNASSGNYGTFVRNGAGTLGLTNIIPVGQAFFVQATIDGAPALTITNAARKHGNAMILKQTESVKDMLRMKSFNDSYSDELIVKFDAAASNAYDDAMDAQKLRGSAEASQIYSLTPQGTELSINNVPYSTQTVTIPVAFELENSSEATLSFTGLESFESSVTIFLEDKLLNKIVDLRSNPIYTFNHSSDDADSRFNLIFYGVTSTGELAVKDYNIWSTIDHINIHIPALTGQKALIVLYDLLGHQLLSQQLNLGSPTTIAVPQFNGIGIVKVISGGNVYSEKVFIQ